MLLIHTVAGGNNVPGVFGGVFPRHSRHLDQICGFFETNVSIGSQKRPSCKWTVRVKCPNCMACQCNTSHVDWCEPTGRCGYFHEILYDVLAYYMCDVVKN